MSRTKVNMCTIEIRYTDGSVGTHDILLWDWFHNNFPTDPNKSVVEIKRTSVYQIEMD